MEINPAELRNILNLKEIKFKRTSFYFYKELLGDYIVVQNKVIIDLQYEERMTG